jgi:cupin 2 domain-containing protein
VSSRARAPLGIIAADQTGDRLVINLFRDLPPRADEEVFTELLAREGVRIERIVSTGQSTAADKPYDQEHDEWVLLLAGSAGLWIEGEGERDLRPGDHVLILLLSRSDGRSAYSKHHLRSVTCDTSLVEPYFGTALKVLICSITGFQSACSVRM